MKMYIEETSKAQLYSKVSYNSSIRAHCLLNLLRECTANGNRYSTLNKSKYAFLRGVLQP